MENYIDFMEKLEIEELPELKENALITRNLEDIHEFHKLLEKSPSEFIITSESASFAEHRNNILMAIDKVQSRPQNRKSDSWTYYNLEEIDYNQPVLPDALDFLKQLQISATKSNNNTLVGIDMSDKFKPQFVKGNKAVHSEKILAEKNSGFMIKASNLSFFDDI